MSSARYADSELVRTPHEEQPVDAVFAAERHRDRTPEREIRHQAVEAIGRVAHEHLARPFTVDLGADAGRPVAPERARPQRRGSLRPGRGDLHRRSRRPGAAERSRRIRRRRAREVLRAVRARSRRGPGASCARRIASASRRRLTRRRCSDVVAQTAAAQETNGRIRKRTCQGRPSRMSSSATIAIPALAVAPRAISQFTRGAPADACSGLERRRRCAIEQRCGGRRRHGEHGREPAERAGEIGHRSDRDEDGERPRRDPVVVPEPQQRVSPPDADDHQHHHHACELRCEQPRRTEQEEGHSEDRCVRRQRDDAHPPLVSWTNPSASMNATPTSHHGAAPGWRGPQSGQHGDDDDTAEQREPESTE